MSLIYKHFVSAVITVALMSVGQAAEISFKDMQGNAVHLKQSTRKVVTFPMPAGSLLMSIDGGTQHLAAMHPDAKKLISEGLLAAIYKDVMTVRSDIAQAGFAPNVETLLQMQPDLIWQWGQLGDELIRPLKDAGLPVAALVLGTESNTREWIRLMGKSLGKEAQANAQIAWRDKVEQSLRKVTSTLAEKDKPRVLYLSRYAPQLRVPGNTGFFQHDISLAGGVNVSAGINGAPSVNIEQILAWQPEVILLNNFEVKLTPEVIYKDPLFADIPAVKNRRVYKIPAGGYLWDAPNQESPLYWQWLSQILHPEKFQWPMRDLIRSAYVQLYGMTPSNAQIDQLLRMDVNKKAAGYDYFAK
jgi:iron complex transport system substrate-binding protein